MKPGEYIIYNRFIELNVNREGLVMLVSNTGDRPVQVGSHFHFFEVNPCLYFEREKAYGMRLNIPSGTAVRFEPGEEKEIELVSIGGQKIIHGLNDLTGGDLNDKEIRLKANLKRKEQGFKGEEEPA